MKLIKCKVCKTEFKAWGKAHRAHCSYECRSITYSTERKTPESQKVSIKCLACKKEFSVLPNKAKVRKFCSKRCAVISSNIKRGRGLDLRKERSRLIKIDKKNDRRRRDRN